MDTGEWLSLEGVATHNLAGFDLQLPKAKLTVITGVSGSGKSSLAFDTLFREGQRRFLSLLPAYARRFASGIGGAEVGAIRGLGPAVAIGQRGGTPNPRATVGTISEVQDLLRLLFARLGEAPEGIRPTRGLFSFNGEGACPACQGLGLEDRLDPDLLVADPTKSLRQGALRVSTPNGYLMYSQVTLEVLDQVLHAHGGDVDTPWQDLSEEVRGVVLHGSDRLRVPTGKHPLENRLKWSGITARPREEGFYRGLLPVMEEILRKRNDSILRFVRTGPCPACQGTRLRPEALAVTWRGHRLPDLTGLCPPDLARALEVTPASAREAAVLAPLAEAIRERCGLMADLGLAHLRFDRPAPSLGPGETQRLRLLGLALGGLRGLLVVLDEPSAGLHPAETGALLRVLRRLRDRGQTVVVVDHDETLARGADWLVDLGPGPGAAGGRLLFSGPPADLLREGGPDSPTRRWLLEPPGPALLPTEPGRSLPLRGLARHGRALPDLDLPLAALTVVTGGSGTGKTSLLEAAAEHLEGHPAFRRILCVDASPIGRTPRSNTATYTGLSDHLRDLFAATPEAKARGFGKGHFSFNTAGGRCEACEGAGVLSIGMQHLGSAEVPCEVCAGRRFHADVLEVRHAGLSIADVLELSVDAAERAFRDHPRLARPLRALQDLGLGHLTLGQSAPSLSGGEAQRVKLATELARAGSGGSLIVLDEPTTGLHAADVATLAEAFGRLTRAGHTLLVADHDPGLLRVADARLDLGAPAPLPLDRPEPPPVPRDLHLWGVRTHTLRDLDITFPGRGLTVVTGPSGSGKSSLVMDTLLAAAQARFADLVAPFARRFLPKGGGADLDGAEGLTAAVAVAQTAGRRQPRATVGTLTGLDEGLRLLWSRLSGSGLPARAFSPATLEGACPACRGLGLHQVCDPDRLVAHPDRALDDGALADDPYTRLLGEPGGQFMATLRTAAEAHGFEISGPWRHLAPGAQRLALEGTGTRTYEVAWSWARGTRSGTHRLSTAWAGLCALVEAEYARVHEDGRGERLEALLMDRSCPACGGDRLQEPMRSQMVAGLTLPYVQRLDLRHLVAWLEALPERLADSQAAVARTLAPGLLARGRMLIAAGLGHLSLRRETATLSGGEAQRARLCEVLSGDLSDLTCILDEPTQGLHPADSARLVDLLKALAAKGNAVVAISHDPSSSGRRTTSSNWAQVVAPRAAGWWLQAPPRPSWATPPARPGPICARSPAPPRASPGPSIRASACGAPTSIPCRTSTWTCRPRDWWPSQASRAAGRAAWCAGSWPPPSRPDASGAPPSAAVTWSSWPP